MEPHADAPDRRQSLVERLAQPRLGGGSWRAAAALAALIATGPAATIVGARLLADRARSDTTLLEREAGPRLARARAQAAARDELRTMLARPGLIATLDALARALPGDARVTRAATDGAGRLRVEVLAPDPDRLRTALRRDPATAMLRDVGQQRGDGGMSVTLESAR